MSLEEAIRRGAITKPDPVSGRDFAAYSLQSADWLQPAGRLNQQLATRLASCVRGSFPHDWYASAESDIAQWFCDTRAL